MKKIFTLFLLCFLSNISFGELINTYTLENVTIIEFGKDAGKLGINLTPMGPPCPSAFTISKDNLVYVCDSVNRRINIYDLNFKFIKTIIEKEQRGAYFSFKINVDSSNNILSLSEENSDLLKIDQSGGVLFKKKYADLPVSVTGSREYFVVDNNVLFYDQKSKDKIKILNDKGEYLTTDESTALLKNINEKNNLNRAAVDTVTENKFKELDKKENIVRFNEAILSANISIHRKYYEAGIKTFRSNNNDDKFKDIFSKDRTFSFIGFDKDNNSYWRCSITGMYESAFVVCSNLGEVLDYFNTGLNTSVYAIAPSGDIYLMDDHSTKDGFPFYKITRRW